MKRMWSPWRSQHIERVGADDDEYGADLFRSIGSDRSKDEENLVIWRGSHVFVVLNLYPYNNGHLLIVPYRPVANFCDLTVDEQVELATSIDRCMRWLDTALRPDGYNVGMNIGKAAGAGIPGHIHTHVIPRWAGDTNFMPLVADIRVVPESMADTFRKLKRAVIQSDSNS